MNVVQPYIKLNLTGVWYRPVQTPFVIPPPVRNIVLNFEEQEEIIIAKEENLAFQIFPLPRVIFYTKNIGVRHQQLLKINSLYVSYHQAFAGHYYFAEQPENEIDEYWFQHNVVHSFPTMAG